MFDHRDGERLTVKMGKTRWQSLCGRKNRQEDSMTPKQEERLLLLGGPHDNQREETHEASSKVIDIGLRQLQPLYWFHPLHL